MILTPAKQEKMPNGLGRMAAELRNDLRWLA